MDLRTTQLLASLDPSSVEILLVLLVEPLPEKGLRTRIPDLKQAQINKKLQRLKQVGLIRHPVGSSGRGTPWEVAVASQTRDLLQSLLALSEALDAEDQAARKSMRNQLGPSLKLIAAPGKKSERAS